ncbi:MULTISPECIES: hypothetical protein [Pseudooceanicola]|uniref:hypothetical protein n=1 Tax=Pseudooceanicola TaxID=1679449 RepID=UPI0019290A81|nr:MULTISPECIES: hypothetical protein [Pseudooceanicola]
MAGAGLWPGRALAHASEGGFVLLLPTGLYTAGGGTTVLVTVLLLFWLPARWARGMFRPWRAGAGGSAPGATAPPPGYFRPDDRGADDRGADDRGAWVSWAVLCGLGWAVWAGVRGPQDPVENPLSLLVWTGIWIFLVALSGLLGDPWRLSPFRGPVALLGRRALLRYPERLGEGPGLVAFLAFAAVLLVDVAPADPDRLAGMVLAYGAWVLAGGVLFGPVWITRGAGIGMLLGLYARLSPVWRGGLGLPGWGVLAMGVPGWSGALFCLAALGVGSFDGLNETFRWLGWIGINPLEFSGRSAVVGPNALGLAASCLLLPMVFGAAILVGDRLAGARAPGLAFRTLAPAVLPIAFGYHLAHYATAALVQGQYALHVLSDLFGGPEVVVTTGYLQTRDSVRVIWLAQAAAVVGGHVLALLLSHALALRLHGDHRRAVLSQLPLALFMVLYTLFGLWLLASPRGS